MCAYTVPHPSEKQINVRIQTNGKQTALQALLDPSGPHTDHVQLFYYNSTGHIRTPPSALHPDMYIR